MWSPLTSTPGNYRRSRRANAIRKIGSAREWIGQLVTSGGDDAGLVGKHHGLDAVSRAELDERVGHVRFDGAWGEVELPMRPRRVVRGRQTTVAAEPVGHRVKHALLGPAARGRARTAGLAVRLRVALAVARLRVRAAAPAHPLVAGLDSAGLLAGRALEVRLHRRRGATQAIGDLRRSTGPRPRGNAAPGRPPDDAREPDPFPRLTRRPSRRATLPRSIGVFVDVGTPSGGAPAGPPTRALPGGLVGQRDARAGSRAGCTVIGYRHEHHAVLDYVLGRQS